MFPEVGNNPNTPFGYNSKIFDFSAVQGNTYDILDWGTENDEYFINYNVKGEFLGYDTAQTPFADFQNCIQFQIQFDTTFTPVGSGDMLKASRIETLWFAPGTGIVKRVIENYYNGILIDTANEELIEFNG